MKSAAATLGGQTIWKLPWQPSNGNFLADTIDTDMQLPAHIGKRLLTCMPS